MKEFIEKLIKGISNKKDYFQRLYECEGKAEHDADLNKATQLAFDDCLSVIEQLAEEYNNGWIPVDKTLPKKSGYYTVTEEQYSLDMRKKMGVRVSHEVQFDAEEQRWYRAKFLKVIAWKEHETPYQPKGE